MNEPSLYGRVPRSGQNERSTPCPAGVCLTWMSRQEAHHVRDAAHKGTSMNNHSSSRYRGCAITTRSVEVGRTSGWEEVVGWPATWTARFVASFSVDADDVCLGPWQQFPTSRFSTRVLAAANALAEARRAIDMKLAEP